MKLDRENQEPKYASSVDLSLPNPKHWKLHIRHPTDTLSGRNDLPNGPITD